MPQRNKSFHGLDLEELCVLAEKAGVETMRFYQGRMSGTQKSDFSPLTDADRASRDF